MARVQRQGSPTIKRDLAGRQPTVMPKNERATSELSIISCTRTFLRADLRDDRAPSNREGEGTRFPFCDKYNRASERAKCKRKRERERALLHADIILLQNRVRRRARARVCICMCACVCVRRVSSALSRSWPTRTCASSRRYLVAASRLVRFRRVDRPLSRTGAKSIARQRHARSSTPKHSVYSELPLDTDSRGRKAIARYTRTRPVEEAKLLGKICFASRGDSTGCNVCA